MRVEADDPEFMDALAEQDFHYPVLCDEGGEFEKYNLLPRNAMLNTFFLDKDNKVILIGSPLLGSSMKKAFYDAMRLSPHGSQIK